MARKISAVLIDLSGTIHIEDAAIPGAIEALSRLRKTNVKLKFVTNTTKESKCTLMDRLLKIGFNIADQEIFTSLTAARHVITNQNLRPFYMLSDNAIQDFKGISTSDPNAVVIGLSPDSFHYEKLTEAFRLIMDGAKLIAIHKSRYYKRNDGLALGPGAFVAALEYAAGVQAECVGKPQESFFLSALNDLRCSPNAAVMIGDDARDDIKGALDCGLLGILVKTGKYRVGDETKFDPRPTDTCDNFAEAVELLIKYYIS